MRSNIKQRSEKLEEIRSTHQRKRAVLILTVNINMGGEAESKEPATQGESSGCRQTK